MTREAIVVDGRIVCVGRQFHVAHRAHLFDSRPSVYRRADTRCPAPRWLWFAADLLLRFSRRNRMDVISPGLPARLIPGISLIRASRTARKRLPRSESPPGRLHDDQEHSAVSAAIGRAITMGGRGGRASRVTSRKPRRSCACAANAVFPSSPKAALRVSLELRWRRRAEESS